MSQQTKWEKEELLKILTMERAVLRCDIYRKISIEREKLISGINTQIKDLEKERNDLLKKHNLFYILLHPELKVFDENTNIERRKILKG